jgi:hypothetical protein
MPRRPETVRRIPCTRCPGELQRVVTGGIIYYTHNPASPTGHTCPEKE